MKKAPPDLPRKCSRRETDPQMVVKLIFTDESAFSGTFARSAVPGCAVWCRVGCPLDVNGVAGRRRIQHGPARSLRAVGPDSHAAAGLTILWIFMFQTPSALLIATMHNLYPVEILSLTLRAKGMGLYGLIQGGAGAVQTYGIGVGISKLGYKIWVVYIAYNCVQLGLSYLIFPETFGLSLEEIDAVSDERCCTRQDVIGDPESQTFEHEWTGMKTFRNEI